MNPLMLVLLVAGGGYLWWKSQKKSTAKTTSNGVCRVSFTKAQFEQKPTGPNDTGPIGAKILQWAYAWKDRTNEPAKSAAVDLMKRLAPQCTWTESTNAIISRPDGTSTSWSNVMTSLEGQTYNDTAGQILPLILGSEPQGMAP